MATRVYRASEFLVQFIITIKLIRIFDPTLSCQTVAVDCREDFFIGRLSICSSIHRVIMGFGLTYYFAAFAVILITHAAIFQVKGQCTVQGRDNGDPLISISAEIQQLKVELFGKLGEQMKSIQAVERRLLEQDVGIKFLNESFQEMKSLQAVDRRSQESDICIKQVRSVHELLNESFQEMISQFHSVNLSLQAVDLCLLNCRIDIKNQTQQSLDLANGTSDRVTPARDCSDIKASGHKRSGVYEVCVGDQPNRVCTNAFCNMETINRTSLVFQRRKDGSVNFNRTWAEYKDGFGNPDGEFWLGNEILHLLTSKRNYTLRVDLEDWEGAKRYAEYSTFSINSSDGNYRLTVGGYSGDSGDGMSPYNGRQFTTIDKDNDGRGDANSAESCGGAWWHSYCSVSTLNGKYYKRNDTVISQTGIHWLYWKNSFTYSLKATEMKLVPVA